MKLRERQWIIGGIFLLITLIYLGRLVQMQVFAHEWKAYAARLTEETETLELVRAASFATAMARLSSTTRPVMIFGSPRVNAKQPEGLIPSPWLN